MRLSQFRWTAAAALFFAAMTIISTDAAACSCFSAYRSSNIVRATVTDIYEPSGNAGRGDYFAMLEIRQTFRGRLTGSVAVHIWGREDTMCGIDLKKGETLNIGIDRDYRLNVYTSSLCSVIGLKQ